MGEGLTIVVMMIAVVVFVQGVVATVISSGTQGEQTATLTSHVHGSILMMFHFPNKRTRHEMNECARSLVILSTVNELYSTVCSSLVLA